MNEDKDKIVLRIANGEYRGNAVWFMRQAGRYLPEYSSIRANRKFLELMKDHRTIIDITKLPLNYYDTDALVIFSDILIPATRLGYSLSYEGRIEVKKMRDDFDYYTELSLALKKIAASYPHKTIIGIVPGPFTFLSYLLDGGERGYPNTKKFLMESGDSIDSIIDELVNFARLQAENGADIIQVFESWIGNVSSRYYDNFIQQIEEGYLKRLKSLKRPIIFFSEGSSHLYDRISLLKANVYSLDWRTDLSYFKNFCEDCIVQGNLDPNLLSLDKEKLKEEILKIMKEGSEMKGHIFNLGHGVPQWADPVKLNFIVETVKEFE